MVREIKLKRDELQRMLDESADQSATQAAALVIHKIPAALKEAIKQLIKEYMRDAVDWILHERWIRIILGIVSLVGIIGYWLKDILK